VLSWCDLGCLQRKLRLPITAIRSSRNALWVRSTCAGISSDVQLDAREPAEGARLPQYVWQHRLKISIVDITLLPRALQNASWRYNSLRNRVQPRNATRRMSKSHDGVIMMQTRSHI